MDFPRLVKDNLGIELNDEQIKQYEIYYDYLIEKNKVMNLTAITEKDEVFLKHFYDSITLAKAIKNEDLYLCDVGAGAGFPSIPLKIAYPNIRVVIVDALAKRIKFLEELNQKLNLKNIEFVHSRAEDFCRNNREKFDIVTARAVKRLNVLDEITIPLVKVNGLFISMKGDYLEELEEAKKGIGILGGKIENIIEFNLPIEESKRSLIVIKKQKCTNIKYPRNFNVITNKPL